MADKKRPATTVLGFAKKKPSRPGNIFTLRLLAFAPGNLTTVASRSPSFDQIFIELLNSVEVNDEGSWDMGDAVALCSLAMFALFFLKTVFFIPKKTVSPKDAAADGSDDDDFASVEVEDISPTPPHAMLPILVNVVLSVENIFAFADHLDDEIEWIRPIARKFRSLTRGIISSSRAYAAAHVFEVLTSFADETTAMKGDSLITPRSTKKRICQPPRPPLHSRLAQMPSTGTTAASTTISAAAARARPRVRCGRYVGARVLVTACLVLLFSESASRVAGVILVAAAASRQKIA